MGIEKIGIKYSQKIIDNAIKLANHFATSTAKKCSKYMYKQGCNIAMFGKRDTLLPLKYNAKDAEIFTPFRRISAKPCSLSEPEWFIKKFESKTKFLPDKWESFSLQNKIDYIVNDRYSRLLSNKIMNKIYKEPVEHHFALSHDGQILAHDIGNDYQVTTKSNLFTDNMQVIDIHNHTYPLTEQIIENYNTLGIKIPEIYAPFSPGDIQHYIQGNITGYVVDASKHKFIYKPKRLTTIGHQKQFVKDYENYERTATKEQEFDKAYSESVSYVKKSDFDKLIANELINKSNNLQMEYTTNIINAKHRKDFLESGYAKLFGDFEEL